MSLKSRRTRRFAIDPELQQLAHRFELFNRTMLFSWVARAGLPAVANGDFHRPEHLGGWKTLLPCEKDPEGRAWPLGRDLQLPPPRLADRRLVLMHDGRRLQIVGVLPAELADADGSVTEVSLVESA